MPLTYDLPGSWGFYSLAWPKITSLDEEVIDRAFVACSLEKVVPYGSYVRCEGELRVETEALKARLEAHLATSPLRTAAEVLAWKRAQEARPEPGV